MYQTIGCSSVQQVWAILLKTLCNTWSENVLEDDSSNNLLEEAMIILKSYKDLFISEVHLN